MGFFGKKHEPLPVAAIPRDPAKAKKFFDHARTVADSRNYDYAIECYIDGLRFEPDNLAAHTELREVALKRKATGGKPPGLTEKFKSPGKDPLDRLLHAESLWAKDPLNPELPADMMACAVELEFPELARWIGKVAVETNQASKSPNKAVYVKVCELFAHVHAFAQASEACKLALQLATDDADLLYRLKNLEAERTMQEGGYAQAAGKEGGFRQIVKDMDKQQQLEREDAITKTDSAVDQEVRRCRALYDENPQDIDLLVKLASALLHKESDEAENEAVGLLEQAYKQTDQYRHRMKIGDIRMRQLNRRLRELHQRLAGQTQNSDAKKKYQALLQEKIKFEWAEYADRVKHYPTDMGLRYELGKRLFALHQYEEAIGAFQQAKIDPRHRVASLDYLGRCYAAKGWFEEALDTFRQGIAAHPTADDRLGIEMRYQLMLVLKQLAVKTHSIEQAREAQKIASQVLQTDINYKHVRQELEEIRGLVDKMQKSQPSG